MDLHDPQFQGLFDIPVDNLLSKPLLEKWIKLLEQEKLLAKLVLNLLLLTSAALKPELVKL